MEEITRADFVFIIYEHADSAGHDYGFLFDNPVYKEGFNTDGPYGYEVIKAIEARDTYESEDGLIILTSDNSGFVTGYGGLSLEL